MVSGHENHFSLANMANATCASYQQVPVPNEPTRGRSNRKSKMAVNWGVNLIRNDDDSPSNELEQLLQGNTHGHNFDETTTEHLVDQMSLSGDGSPRSHGLFVGTYCIFSQTKWLPDSPNVLLKFVNKRTWLSAVKIKQ